MSQLRFGYNTNGFAHHRLEDALQIIQDLGYDSVALTLDHHALNPFDSHELRKQLPRVRKLIKPLIRGAAIETGARFLLDPWQKHQPTLLSKSTRERARRFDFLARAVEMASALGIKIVSFWSGSPIDAESSEKIMKRLVSNCRKLADYGARHDVHLAFEPEPGMFIDTMSKFEELFDRVHHPHLGLTIDIGHLQCLGETPIAVQLRRWKDWLWNIHIEDMKRGVHDHLMFGEGEIDFPPVLRALSDIGYEGAVHVELSRHSHDAVATARNALAFLQAARM